MPRSRLAPSVLVAAVLAVPLAVPFAAPAAAAPAAISYLIRADGPAADNIFPEGIATDADHFYTGSTADGTIYRGALSDRVATPYLPGGADGRTSAVGLKQRAGQLFVAGGATGRFFVYDIATKALVGSYAVPAGGGTFLNDVVVAPDGAVYITDSVRPVLYRIPPGSYATTGVQTLQVFVDFTGSALQYQPGFNVNGIVASSNSRQLVVAQSNTGSLFRIRIADRKVSAIDLGGQSVSGDGLLLRDHRVYAVERQGETGFLVKIRVSDDFLRGTVLERVTNPAFDDPTTAAFARGRVLVVNSQFGEQGGVGTLDPFTVVSVPRP